MGTVLLVGRDGGMAGRWRRAVDARGHDSLWFAPPDTDETSVEAPDRRLALDQPVVVRRAVDEALSIRLPAGVIPLDSLGAPVAADVAERFDLPGAGRSAVVRCMDRVSCRRAWFDRGVPHAEYRVLSAGEDPAHVVRQVGVPADLHSARRDLDHLSRRVSDADDAPEHLDGLRQELARVGAGADPVLVERHVGGSLVGVLVLVDPGGVDQWHRWSVAGAADEGSDPGSIPGGLDESTRIEVDRVVTDALAAVDLGVGPVQVSVSVCGGMVRVLDMAPAIEAEALERLIEDGHDPIASIVDLLVR